jgi:ADP-ribose pyrophosphatase
MTGVRQTSNSKWLNLFEAEYVTPEGRAGSWTFASRKKNPKVGEHPLVADAVVIIAIHKGEVKDENGEVILNQTVNKLVVTKEFRYPLGDYEVGVPAGLFDSSESAAEAAKRELKEEAGLDLIKILFVSPPVISSAGLSDESVQYVVCECVGTPSDEGNEETEEIHTLLVSLDELRHLFLYSGKKVSAKALPFYFVFQAMGEISWPISIK